MVNKEAVKKLVAALRSGEYKQGKEQLRSGDQFCCLGVACDLVKDELDGRWVSNSGFIVGEETHLLRTSFLPREVENYYGFMNERVTILNKNKPKIKELEKKIGKECESLVGFNDNGATFEEIADIIEEQYLG